MLCIETNKIEFQPREPFKMCNFMGGKFELFN